MTLAPHSCPHVGQASSLSRDWTGKMPVLRLLAALALLLVLCGRAEEPKPATPPPAEEKPITTAKGELGDLLRKWYAEGTAAGNKGDIYDNRDRTHSELDRGPYPQLQKWQYSKEELDRRMDWAFFGGLRPGIVFGNSSTAAGPTQGGSNPRMAYLHPQGLEVLYRQYRGNNLYMYPCHHDHRPGHNGYPEGYGDLYPVNTPYLLISQGSSGTDQPFMHAVPFTLAAFRPEVKKKLAETGLLMPTVQMLLRFTNKHLQDPAKEYLTGKAHPPVFEGSWVNDLKMVQMAHEITLEDLPPLALLKVVEEDAPLDGRDFFEPGASEKHGDTPAVVSRIFRSKHYIHRMVVSAAESLDANKRPLVWHWAVLSGDASRIKIERKNAAGSVAELLVPYHARRPVADGSALETNRVDIGVFVHNGKYYSPPAFITFCFIDHEARTYDEAGRILEIGYKTGETSVSVNDWNGFFALLQPDAATWPARFLRKQFKPDESAGLLEAAKAYKPAADAAASAQAKQQAAEAAKNKAAGDPKAEQDYKAAQKALEAAQKAVKDLLNQKRESLAAPVQELAERVLAGWAKSPGFFLAYQAEIEAFLATPEGQGRKGALAGARSRLAALGIISGAENKPFELRLLRAGGVGQSSGLPPTRFEQAMLERFNGEVLSGVLYPNIVRSEFRVNYVPPEISEPPAWRDVYRYDAKGNELGWTRYGSGAPVDFTAEGLKVLEKDAKGRPLKAQTVKYEPEKISPEQRQKLPRPYWRATLQLPGTEIRYYAYEGEDDWKGKVVRTERVEEGKGN